MQVKGVVTGVDYFYENKPYIFRSLLFKYEYTSNQMTLFMNKQLQPTNATVYIPD